MNKLINADWLDFTSVVWQRLALALPCCVILRPTRLKAAEQEQTEAGSHGMENMK